MHHLLGNVPIVNVFLLFLHLSNANGHNQSEETVNSEPKISSKFSGPPSGLPVKRVLLHGNPVLLQQVFVEPIRPKSTNGRRQSIRDGTATMRKEEEEVRNRGVEGTANSLLGCALAIRRRKRQGCGCAGARCNGCGGCSASCPGNNRGCAGDSLGYNPQSVSQSRVVPFQPQPEYRVLPTVPAPISTHSSSYQQPQPQPQEYQQSQVQPSALPAYQPQQQENYQLGSQQPQSQQQAWQRQGQAGSPTYRQPAVDASPPHLLSFDQQHRPSYSRLPPTTGIGPNLGYVVQPKNTYPKPQNAAPKKGPYPLPECYTDDSNFMCCNAQLEETIHAAYQSLLDTIKDFHRCNVQKIANSIQQMAEKRFNTSFEAIVGLSDFASKSNFYENYICKIERDNRFILAYATPRWDLECEDCASDEVQEQQPTGVEYATRPPIGNPQYQVSPRTGLQHRRRNHFYQWR